MDISRYLVTALIDSDQLSEVTRSGITEEFLDGDSKTVFAFIKRHYADYKQVPSRSAVQKAFPNYVFETCEEPLEYYVEELKDAYKRLVLEEALTEASQTYQKNTSKTEHLLRDALAKLTVTSRSFKDVELAASAESRIEAYEQRSKNPGPDGILSGWEKVDDLTLGFHPEEFIVLVGEKYSFKSWLMIWMAYQAMLQGERVLFVTKEMSQDAMARRFDSIFSQVKFESLRRGELSEIERARFKEKLTELHNSNYKITIARNGVNTIEEIEQKAIELDSTIVFGDSIYLFPANSNQLGQQLGETQRRMAISQRCKQTAKTLGIPFVVSTQGGRKKTKDEGAHLDRIEWSNAFSQDADTVFYIEKNEIDTELDRIKFSVLKSRDGDTGECFVKQDFSYMQFTQDNASVTPTDKISFDEEEKNLWES